MSEADRFYLFRNSIVIKASSDLEELKEEIVKMKLHIDTAPYYCDLSTIKDLEEYSDVHEGVWFPVCDLLDKNNKFVDIFIVKDFYAYQDKNWQKEINKFNKALGWIEE